MKDKKQIHKCQDLMHIYFDIQYQLVLSFIILSLKLSVT